MPTYRLGQERVASDIALAGLAVAGTEPASIEIRRGWHEEAQSADWQVFSDEPAPEAGIRLCAWHGTMAGGAWQRLRYDYRNAFIDFLIRDDGRDIRVRHNDPVSDTHIATLLEGPILGRALRLRGLPSLHATVLARDGVGIALMGASGAGKSSLAMALVRQGCDLVTDDIAMIEPQGDGISVYRGRARVRLWPDMAHLDATNGPAEPLFAGLPEMRKTLVHVPAAGSEDLIKLRGLFVLGPRNADLDRAEIASLPLPEQLAVLSSNVYGEIALDKMARRREFALLSHWIGRAPVHRLTMPDRIDALLDIAADLDRRLFA